MTLELMNIRINSSKRSNRESNKVKVSKIAASR